jgi:hypothetical protein
VPFKNHTKTQCVDLNVFLNDDASHGKVDNPIPCIPLRFRHAISFSLMGLRNCSHWLGVGALRRYFAVQVSYCVFVFVRFVFSLAIAVNLLCRLGRTLCHPSHRHNRVTCPADRPYSYVFSRHCGVTGKMFAMCSRVGKMVRGSEWGVGDGGPAKATKLRRSHKK